MMKSIIVNGSRTDCMIEQRTEAALIAGTDARASWQEQAEREGEEHSC
jgi:hypothetical protein